ncbi:MAG: hypothetical protein KDD64_03950, partial [Bdellovibrionales bacterium]|nr:hypothetical protein [Bdellovibrionales bacterium]
MLKLDQLAIAEPTILQKEQFPPHLPPAPSEAEVITSKTQIEQTIGLRSLLRTDPKLFERHFHRAFDLYCRAFPDPSEREPQEVLRGYLEDPTSEFNIYVMFNRDGELIAGRNVGVRQAQLPSGETFRFAVGEH